MSTLSQSWTVTRYAISFVPISPPLVFLPFPQLGAQKRRDKSYVLGTKRRRYALIRALPFKGRQRDMSPTAFYSPERRRIFRSSIFLSSFPFSLSPRSREKYGKGVAERKEEGKMRLVRRSSVSRPLWRMDRDLDQSFSGGGRRRGRHAITPFPPLREGGRDGRGRL